MSTVDGAFDHLPAPIHELTATTLAPAVALSGSDGQIRATGMQGLFLADTRVLSEARLCIAAVEPQPLLHLREGPGRTRFVAVARGIGDVTIDPTVRVERTRQVRPDGMDEELTIRCTSSARSGSTTVTIDLPVRPDAVGIRPSMLGRGPDCRCP